MSWTSRRPHAIVDGETTDVSRPPMPCAANQITTSSIYVPRCPGLAKSGAELARAIDEAVVQILGARELLNVALAPIATGGLEADSPATTGVLVTVLARERT